MTHFRPTDTLYLFAIGLVSFLVTAWFWPVSTGLSAACIATAWVLRRYPRGPLFALVLQVLMLMGSSWAGGERLVLFGTLVPLWMWVGTKRRERLPLGHYIATFFAPLRALGGPYFEGFDHRPSATRWSVGLDRVLIGCVEKFVIADGFASHADRLLFGAGPLTAMESWTGIIACTVQCVFMVAGLLHIGAGLSTMLGLSDEGLPNRPTHARSVGAFLTQLHPTLVARTGRWWTLGALLLALACGELWWCAAIFVLWAVYALQADRLRWLTIPAVAMACVLARTPELARLAFIADGCVGWFGLGTLSLALPTGVVLLAVGPAHDPRLPGMVRGLLLALVVAFASNSRLLL